MASSQVGLLTNEELRAVVFPTSDTLRQIRDLENDPKPLILVNPQWKTSGALTRAPRGR